MVEQASRWRAQARRGAFEAYRRQATTTWVEASGGSMRPLIVPGAWMLVQFGATPTSLGEIVLFPLGDLIVAHRVVAWRDEQEARLAITKGDAEPYCDPPLRPAEVLGVVQALRYRQGDRPVRLGCAGGMARAIARFSHLSSRGMLRARRGAALLPGPLQRRAMGAISLFAHIAARVFLAPLHWAARIQIARFRLAERG